MLKLWSMVVAITATCVFNASPAIALVSSAWNYIKQYQIGIDYASSYDKVSSSYETSTGSNGLPANNDCEVDPANTAVQRCTVHMRGGQSSGFGLFLQQAFKRQGTFYFDYDIGFGARYLNGKLDEAQIAESQAAGLPLREMSFSLLALVMRPYITVGITPQTWPDLLISLGPAAQVAVGQVSVNDKKENAAIATSSNGLIGGFLQLEAVLWRFGDGAFSLFTASDFSGNGRGSKFYPKALDDMRDIRAQFSRSVGGGVFGFFGAKLVLNWP